MKFITDNPGCYLRLIKTKLGLGIGTTQYQLDRLEKMGKVTSMKSFYRAYYPARVTNIEEKILMQVLAHERLREVLLNIIELGEPTQNEILKFMRISLSSLIWHLQRLLNVNIIVEKKDGRFKRYVISGQNRERSCANIMEILRTCHLSTWDKWSSRITEFF